MPVRVNVTVPKGFEHLDLDHLLTEDDLRQMGQSAILAIKLHTAQERSGQEAWPGLSEMYGAAKQAALGHRRANLEVSGRMLNALTVTEATPRSVSIGFEDRGASVGGGTFIAQSARVPAIVKAEAHQYGRGHLPTREFLSLGDDELEPLVAALDRAIQKRLDAL